MLIFVTTCCVSCGACWALTSLWDPMNCVPCSEFRELCQITNDTLYTCCSDGATRACALLSLRQSPFASREGDLPGLPSLLKLHVRTASVGCSQLPKVVTLWHIVLAFDLELFERLDDLILGRPVVL